MQIRAESTRSDLTRRIRQRAPDDLRQADGHRRAQAGAQGPQPAEYNLSLKQTNADRKELGLKPLKKALRQTGGTGEPFKPGPGTLQGQDTSHWTSQAGFLRSIQGKQWTTVESSNGGVDPTFKSRWALLGQRTKQGKMKLRVAYHFMSPGSGVIQANHFLNTVGVHGKLTAGTRLCLDFEGSALLRRLQRQPKGAREVRRLELSAPGPRRY